MYINWERQAITPGLESSSPAQTMSLSCNFFSEFLPLFRTLEDPLFGWTPVTSAGWGHLVLDDLSFGLARNGLRPSVDVAEEGNSYIIEAALLGVRKELRH